MEFRRTVDLGSLVVSATLTSNITQRGSGLGATGRLSLNSDSDPQGILLQGEDGWVCNPSYVDEAGDSRFSVIGDDKDKPIQIIVKRFDENDTRDVLEFPPLSLLKAADVCANQEIADLPPQIDRVVSGQTESDQCFGFLQWISTVISYTDYIAIVEQLARVSPQFRHDLARQAETQVQQMLTGRSYDAEYSINSFEDLESRVSDLEDLDPIRRLSKKIDTRDVIKNSVNEIAQGNSMRDVAEFCYDLEIHIYFPEVLKEKDVDAILSYLLVEDNLVGAWDVITNCMPDSKEDIEYDDLKKQALNAKNPGDKLELWRASLPLAKGSHDVRISLANYLYTVARTRYSSESAADCSFLYKAAHEGFEKGGIAVMSQYAEYYHHFMLGHNYSHMNEYLSASDEFRHSYRISEGRSSDSKRELVELCVTSLRYWASNLADHYRYRGQYTKGIEILQAALSDLEVAGRFPDLPKEEKKYDITLLRAKQRILEMERYLIQGEYEVALETAGAVIKEYAEIQSNNSQYWAITKRKEIQAIIHETNGELVEAADLHRDIGNSDQISSGRQNWHVHRADICEAKHLALEGKYEDAKSQLLRIQNRTNRLESEAQDLAVVLDAVIDYESDKRRNFRDALDRLSNEEEDKGLRQNPMRLEYNYEDPLAVIHAAQWLRTYNVDPEVLSMAVEVALQASLIPLHAGDAAASVGLAEVSLRDQWITELPGPIAQRITQIQLDGTMPQTDYVGLGARLFHLLELYLAIFGEYFGSRQWGKDWRRELSDSGEDKKMALGDLANVFTKCESLLESGAEIAELIEGGAKGESVTKLRNDIDHAKTDDVRSSEYKIFQNRVMEIIQQSSEDAPVVGQSIEARGEGAFRVELMQLLWWRPQRRVFIQTEAELEDDELYYLPHSRISDAAEQGSTRIPEEEIIPVRTDRVRSKFF